LHNLYYMQQMANAQLCGINTLLDDQYSCNDTLLTGNLGLALYYYNLYKSTRKSRDKGKAEQLLNDVFSHINQDTPTLAGASLSSGAAGLGYLLNEITRDGLIDLDFANEIGELDQYLCDSAEKLIQEDNFDYLHGAPGIVNYFVERSQTRGEQSPYLDFLVDKICACVEEDECGYWFSGCVEGTNGQKVVNFSLSHGLCGILLVLINAYPHSIHKAKLEKTVINVIQFILKHKMDVEFSRNQYSFFPFFAIQGATEISAPNRLGWCYGDLNEVLLFYRAGKWLGDKNLINLADLIGMQSVMRKSAEATLVSGASFCHGAAGLAQFYRTLYRERPLDAYKDGYEYWLDQTVHLLEEDRERNAYAGKEHEVMEGLVGVGLTLLSYVSDQDLKWSKLFLL
jgi:lantibiotic modifying enzyme